MAYGKRSNNNTRVAHYDDTKYVYDGVNSDIAVYNIQDLEVLDDESYRVLVFGRFTDSPRNKSVKLEINGFNIGSHLAANTSGANHLGWSLDATIHKENGTSTVLSNMASASSRTPLSELDATAGATVLGDLTIKAIKNGSPVAGEIIVDGIIITIYKKWVIDVY